MLTSRHRFILKVSLTGNPDPGDPEDLGIPPLEVPVRSLETASELTREYIRTHDLGGEKCSGGRVYEGEDLVATINFNGRRWSVVQRTWRELSTSWWFTSRCAAMARVHECHADFHHVPARLRLVDAARPTDIDLGMWATVAR